MRATRFRRSSLPHTRMRSSGDRALKDGVVCYLRKPVDDDHLERCLRSALESGSEENSRIFLACRQSELKYCAPRSIDVRPQPTTVGGDDGPADRQPHPNSAGLCGVEGLEHPLELVRIHAGSGIVHRDQISLVWPCSVLIDNCRAPSSTELIASTEFRIKLRTTCCS